MTPKNVFSSRTTISTTAALSLVAVIVALSMAAATPAAAMSRNSLNADGDSCDIALPGGTKEPGTVKGLECCSTLHPDTCVVILKPFPGAMARSARHG